MKRSATSSAGLPLPPSQCRKRDGVGEKASGTPDPPSSPAFGEAPPSPRSGPIPTRPPRPRDPPEEGGGGELPRGQQAHLPRGSCRRGPPGPGLPGSNRLSIQLPVARSPGRARPTPPGRSPGLDFATFPTPEGEPGGSPAGREGGGAETTCNGSRGQRGCGRGAAANESPRVAHPPPPASQVAHSSSGGCPSASRVLGTAHTIRKTRRGRGHHSGGRWGRAPQGVEGAANSHPPARLLSSLTQPAPESRPANPGRPALSPPGPLAPRPLLPDAGAGDSSSPWPPARLGLLPLRIPKMPPAPFKVHRGRVSHQTLSGGSLAPSPTHASRAVIRRDHFTLGIKRIKDLSTILGLFYRRHPLPPHPPPARV